MESVLTGDQYKHLLKLITPIVEEHVQSIEKEVTEKIIEIKDSILDLIVEKLNFIGTFEYFKLLLNQNEELKAKYQFNKGGDVEVILQKPYQEWYLQYEKLNH